MKTAKIEKLEIEIEKTEDAVTRQAERLKELKERLDRARQEEILRVCTEEGITVENIHKVISEYRKEKNAAGGANEIEYEVF